LKLNANELAGLDSFFSGWTTGFFKGFDGGGGKPANFGAVCVSKIFGFCVVVSGFDKPPNKEGPLLNGFDAFFVDDRDPNDDSVFFSFDDVDWSGFEDKKEGFEFNVSEESGFDDRNEDFENDPNEDLELKEEVDGVEVSDVNEGNADGLEEVVARKVEGCDEGNAMGFEVEPIENAEKGDSDFCGGIDENMLGVLFVSPSLFSDFESWSLGSFSGVGFLERD